MRVLLLVEVLAALLTVARTWPQFLRIVIRKDSTGVSAFAWGLVMTAHVGWLMYGIQDHVLLLMVVNALAASGCAAIMLRLGSVGPVVVLVMGTSLAAWTLYSISNGVLLSAVVGLSLIMFLPQAVKVSRAPHEGVSPVTWALSAASSITWIFWSFMVSRPALAAAHYVMLPTALVIMIRAMRGAPLAVSESVRQTGSGPRSLESPS